MGVADRLDGVSSVIELMLTVCWHQINSGLVEFSGDIEGDPAAIAESGVFEWLGLVIVSAGVCSHGCVDST